MNSSNTEGVFDQAKGKLKQAFGEATDNQSLANEGAADQVKGHAEETWGNVKDTAHSIGRDDAAETRVHGETTGHDVRSGITNAAEDVKNSINRGLDHLKEDHARRF